MTERRLRILFFIACGVLLALGLVIQWFFLGP